MEIDSPLGRYPLQLRRLERRGGGLAIVGLLAGIESSVILERRELDRALQALAAATAGATALLLAAGRGRRGR